MIHKVLNKEIYIDGSTGLFSFDKDLFNQLITRRENINFDDFRLNYSEYNTTSVTFCINLSDACNLGCDYCLNPNKQNRSVSLEDALLFLDL